MSQSLFERCGGFAVVRKIVAEFYDRVLESPRLAAYFEDVNMRMLVDHQTKFIAMLMGGPASFSDDALRRAHANMGISPEEFRETAALLIETLEDFGVDEDDITLVTDALMRKEHLIVTRPATVAPTGTDG